MKRYAVVLMKSCYTTIYVEAEDEAEASEKVENGDYEVDDSDWETSMGPDVDELYPVDENDNRIWEDEE